MDRNLDRPSHTDRDAIGHEGRVELIDRIVVRPRNRAQLGQPVMAVGQSLGKRDDLDILRQTACIHCLAHEVTVTNGT